MPITSRTSGLVAASGTSSNSLTHSVSLDFNPWDMCLLVVAFDNASAVDGNNNECVSVTGLAGGWMKLGEHVNANGAAGAGVGVSLWLGEITAALPFASYSLTINFSSAIVDKCSSMWVFSRSPGSAAQLAAPPVTSSTDGAVGYGSAALTGLPSANRLYFRALAKEANGTTQVTPSTGFTALTTSRSRNNALAVLARGEFRLNTSTGETSNPTLAITGDTAGIFVAIDEVLARQVKVVG